MNISQETLEVLWDTFVAHLENTAQPLPREKGQKHATPHVNMLGSVKVYKKLFIAANLQESEVVKVPEASLLDKAPPQNMGSLAR